MCTNIVRPHKKRKLNHQQNHSTEKVGEILNTQLDIKIHKSFDLKIHFYSLKV